MFEVTVSDRFSASHQLCMPDGSAEPKHAHDWRVQVTCSGERLDPSGLLLDFTWLRGRLRQVLSALEGRHLNDLPAFANQNPSAEKVAVYIAAQLAASFPDACSQHPSRTPAARLACVAVEEEIGCVARYLCDEPGTANRSGG